MPRVRDDQDRREAFDLVEQFDSGVRRRKVQHKQAELVFSSSASTSEGSQASLTKRPAPFRMSPAKDLSILALHQRESNGNFRC